MADIPADAPDSDPDNDPVNLAVLSYYYEAPTTQPEVDEIWCYSDRPC